MPVGPVTNRVYNALNGNELKTIIFNQIKAALDNDTQFSQNRTFPVVEFNWNVTIKAYPLEPPEQTTKGAGVITQVDKTSNEPKVIPTEESKSVEVALEGGKTTDETKFPDKVREEEEGLEVRTPTTIPGVGTVDKAAPPKSTPNLRPVKPGDKK